ncbi:MAG TPA: VCBS repeat-containing protein [Rhizomicrobium sp.]|nr:VCBS repeat-containing protein [Rhizomicrobium sp.]
MRLTFAVPAMLLAFAPAAAPAQDSAKPGGPPPITAPFDIHPIAQGIGQGYSVAVADFNHDGKPDVVSLGLTADAIYWYENPFWTPHLVVTAKDAPKPVYLDAADIDGDGIPEIALAYDFNTDPHKDVGTVAILHHDGDAARPWKIDRIVDHVPSTHRIRFADIDGNGKPALIVAPILAGTATGFPDPDRNVTPLYAYRPGRDWQRQTITLENHGVVHGLDIEDWTGDRRDDVITSGYSGTYVHAFQDGQWRRSLLTAGKDAPWPGGGSSDAASGIFNGRKFFVTIEPFHGNMVVVHMPDGKGGYSRQVIDDRLANGHALVLLDVDGDGRSEIVAGGNGQPTSMYFYKADADGTHWTRYQMDDDMAPAACVAADMKGTGRATDVVCQDMRAPYWLKWYAYDGRRRTP